MSKITASTRDELVRAVGERYRVGARNEKLRILDEFVALTGYHRKHAIRMLNKETSEPKTVPRARARIYDEAVRQALIVLWEAADRLCGKRLKPLLPVLVPALERHGHLRLAEAIRAHVLAVSAATIDRMLAGARARTPGRRRHVRTKPAIRGSIPVRTFADWKDPPPGYLEADLVAHCGGNMVGSFAHTLVLTDIASGWTECVPVLVRESTLIVDGVDRLRKTMPFPILGLDTDNGSEFINDVLLAYCREQGIEFTRSRPYRKNDQALVEQKNGAIVRRLVGYGRLEGLAAGEALARLYAASRLFVNCFQPSFKLAEKRRVGARVTKRYHPPETPCARLLASEAIPEPMKERLRAVMVTLDPLRLLDEIRTVQHHVAGLATGEVLHVLPHRDADLDRFLKGLATAWKDGEVRPTHRKAARPDRHWRTRKDPFESVWPRLVIWLDTEPHRTAKELFARLQAEEPGTFADGQLRTLQRRVKDWRRAAARRLVFAEPQPAVAPQEPTH
jgi:hypothetical protein